MADTEKLLERLSALQKNIKSKQEEHSKIEKELIVEQTKYNQFLEELKTLGVSEEQLEDKIKEAYAQAEEKINSLENLLKEVENGNKTTV